MPELNEYTPGSPFPGLIESTYETSEPWWPRPVRAHAGAPNVLFIVLDDTGFGHLGCYGSPIRTPNLDALAAGGLRYTNMHTTALCSPSRSCILTGRNHHANAMACVTEGTAGYPGYNGNIPFENGFLSEILQLNGYSTYALGKWHLTPNDQISAAGPYDRWPLGRGFERYYGFLGGETHQYYPELVYDNHRVEPPRTPEDGYHVTEDLVDHAIQFIADAKQIAPAKPFFMYFCPGAMHAPHHVAPEWTARYAGAFDDGWEAYREGVLARQIEMGIAPEGTELSRHDPDVKPWDACSPDERRLYARMMEVFAGFLEHTDHHIGRLLDFLDEIGERENTIVMCVSDNGASAEGGPSGSVNENLFFNNVPESLEANLAMIDELGGPTTFNHFAWGWAWAGNTPFRRWKRETYRGGVSDPFIVQWPAGIAAHGEVRHQYAHIIDMLPTVLDAAGIEAPAAIRGVPQSDIQGVSMTPTFADPDAPSGHTVQYFEMLGHRSIYSDGWRAVCPWPGSSFSESGRGFGAPIVADTLQELDADGWELYHVDVDWAENHNIAQENPAKLAELIEQWYEEATRYHVFPIDGRGTQRLLEPRPKVSEPRARYVMYPGTQAVPAGAGPNVLNRTHSIAADVEIADGSAATGMLFRHGGTDGGYALFMRDGFLHYVHNYVALDYFHLVSPEPIAPGAHELRYEFEVTAPPDFAHGHGAAGRGQLYVDRVLVAEMELPYTTPLMFGLTSGIEVGVAHGAPIGDLWQPDFPFSDIIRRVTVDVSGEVIVDLELEARNAMAQQ